jgi:hypothetical protein
MVTVATEMSLSSSIHDAWAALGRRQTYFCFPGITPRAGSGTAKTLDHNPPEEWFQLWTPWIDA